MFGKRIKLFTLLGFEVRADLSWLIILVLVTWSLARSIFPRYCSGLSDQVYWVMGVLGALGLFLSIVLHELSHSLVARRFGLPINGITLFIFGGVAEMNEEPPSAKAEFLMAIAGPLSSVGIGLFCLAVAVAGSRAGMPRSASGVFGYLAMINFLLAGFNLMPAFPLDGGRVLRSLLWLWKGNIRWATRLASAAGSVFGLALVFLGILNIVGGQFVAGIWWLLIGMFVRNAAQMSLRTLLTRQALEGHAVREFMKDAPITAPAGISVSQLVEDYVYRYHHKFFPVLEDGRLVGCVSTREVKEVPKEAWGTRQVKDIALPCSGDNAVTPDMDATQVLALMHRTGASRLMVLEGGQLAGVITLKDLLRFLSLKLDLEGEN